MAAKGNTRAIILPFGLDKSRIIWDPGGSIILHRLGGKPNLRRGECQDMAMGLWAGQHVPHNQGPRKTL